MASWRDHILEEFSAKVARLTLVADPDALLLEEGILEGIRERGFELIPFDDHIAFRYAYETKFRSFWDSGQKTDLVVVLRSNEDDLRKLPYDLLEKGRTLSFNLGDIFPGLSYPVVSALNRADLEPLFLSLQQYSPGQLGVNASKEFILRHIFEVAPELIKEPSDLLRMLIRRHYKGQRVPLLFDERLVILLRKSNSFDEWPLDTLLGDRETFFAFLQERWPVFLEGANSGNSDVREGNCGYNLSIKGPVHLPFDHDDIRVYLDNLFLEGFLKSVVVNGQSHIRDWTIIGVSGDNRESTRIRLEHLLSRIEEEIPTPTGRHDAWVRFARQWAELAVLYHTSESSSDYESSIKTIQSRLDESFFKWLERKYSGLANLPSSPPVMVHHIPRYLASKLDNKKTDRVALLVIDGLALDQWLIVKESLLLSRPKTGFREDALFAWVPTTTSVSRQSIFFGEPPFFFSNSIGTTSREPSQWKRFWGDQDYAPDEVFYCKSIGNGDLSEVEGGLSHPRTRIVGLVVDTVDQIMHGMQMGTAGMHNQVRQWAQEGFLAGLLNLLLDLGYQVFLTSDHGNVEAVGTGRPSEGSIAGSRGERVRIYPDRSLRESVRSTHLNSLAWPPVGLPQNYFPLVASDRTAFTQQESKVVSHGGASIEELIVPFIEIFEAPK